VTPRDYLAELEELVGTSRLSYETLAGLLGIGQQLRRIADQMEPPDPDAAMRAYLAREGRL